MITNVYVEPVTVIPDTLDEVMKTVVADAAACIGAVVTIITNYGCSESLLRYYAEVGEARLTFVLNVLTLRKRQQRFQN